MHSKKFLMTAVAALLAAGVATTAGAFQTRGGARTSVSANGGANPANVETRQANRTERTSERQNTMQQASANRANAATNISNNRANVANNVSNNRANVANNYNDNHGGWYNDHPVATAAAVTTAVVGTAAVIGSIVHTLPPSCSAMTVNGVTYQQCGSTWYQPQYAGTTVQYVVVNAPPHY